MDKKELLNKIKTLKNIKPDSHWAFSSRRILLAFVLSLRPAVVVRRGFYFPVFSKVVLGLCVVVAVFSGLAVGAQNVGINSPLHSLKILSQKTLIAVMPEEYKLDLKIAFAHNLINDLAKVTADGKALVAINDLSRDLKEITFDLKQVSHPEKAMVLSKKIQEQTSQLKNNLPNFSSKNPGLSDSLKQVAAIVENVDAQVFAVINEAENKINNCPAYVTKQLDDLTNYLNSVSLSEDNQKLIAKNFAEANDFLKAGRCIDALMLIDTINKNLSLTPAK